MRITFVLPPVNMSGGIRVVSIYARALEAKGHDVFLVSTPPAKTPLKTKLKSVLKGSGWPSNSNSSSYLDGTGLNHHVLERYRPPADDDVPDADVVIATWWKTAEWVNALSASKGTKVYFIQHHEVHSHLPVMRCRATYDLPLHKVVIARWLQDVMCTEYGDTMVDLVPNSVDHDQFFAAERGKQPVPTLGFLYSPIPFKGVDVTLQGIDLLRGKIANLRVIAFGTRTPQRGSDFDSRIEFYQSPAQENIRDIYAQCDVWVTASQTEGFNLPAMEAMACRTPVVSTKAGWPAEAIVDSKNGYLVNVDDVEALAKCIYKVLSMDDDEWREMSQNAFDTVKDSTWQTSANLFEKALEHAVQRSTMHVDTRS